MCGAGCGGLQVLDDWILPTLANKGDKVDLRCNYKLQVILERNYLRQYLVLLNIKIVTVLSA
jgi:hypothetical protein